MNNTGRGNAMTTSMNEHGVNWVYCEIDWIEPKGEHGVNWHYGEHGVNW